MKRSELKIAHGGLMRCCVLSCIEWIDEDPSAQVVEGERLACNYEGPGPAKMIVRDGAIHWLDPISRTLPPSAPSYK